MKETLRILLIALLATLVVVPSGAVMGPAGETYKQSEDGLAKEFEGFLKAYHKGDDAGMDAAFGVFRLPNAKEWFAEHFEKEDAERLSGTYAQQVADAQASLIEDMNRAGAGNKFSVHCQARGDVPAGTGKAGGEGVIPVKAVRVEQFLLEFQAGGTRQKFMFMANFVYEDGAYRFVGGGGGPFWGK
jgi:hypothetical protein